MKIKQIIKNYKIQKQNLVLNKNKLSKLEKKEYKLFDKKLKMSYLKTEHKIFEGDKDSIFKKYNEYIDSFNDNRGLKKIWSKEDPQIKPLNNNMYMLISKVEYRTHKKNVNYSDYEMINNSYYNAKIEIEKLKSHINNIKENFWKNVFTS